MREWVAGNRDIGHVSASEAGDARAALPVSEAWLRDAVTERLPLLLAAARALMHNDADARDLTQQTAEIALRHGAALRDPAAITAWLFTIQAREAFRLTSRLRRWIDIGRAALPSVPGPDPESLAIRTALHALPPRTRLAVVLHHMVGLPVADVAVVLGVSQNTVKTQLRLGLARLREELR
jgi:DNA-directed RNA polymerase specialized sigma24 family protein